MLYLEDYLEMIEHLPQEVRDRFTEIRELDLSVQNNIDLLEKKSRSFFGQCKRDELKEEEMQEEYQKLQKEYQKVVEDADEKVSITSHLHDLVTRYSRRLEGELFKFKCELEADNQGITEILEKRALEHVKQSNVAQSLLNSGVQKENRYYGMSSTTSVNNSVLSSGALPVTPTSTKDHRYRSIKTEKRRESSTSQSSILERRNNFANSLTPSTPTLPVVRQMTPALASTNMPVLPTNVTTPGVTTPVAYNLQSLSASGSTAIAAAASQAIVATQQMQQGRRTASLKASYEAIHGGGAGPTEFWINRDIAGTLNMPAQNSAQGSTHSEKKKKKLNTSMPATISSSISNPMMNQTQTVTLPITAASSPSLSLDSVEMLSSSTVSGMGSVGIPPGLGLSPIASTSAGIVSRVNSMSVPSSSLAPSANMTLNENGLVIEQTPEGEWAYDPNEPRYCTCNQVSYGDMVACDNEACPYEWFHYPCVGITQPPKGKWYCPKCTASMRRRGNRKN